MGAMRGSLLAALACGLLPPGWSAGAAEDPLLARIRRSMAETLRHMPDYTCLETIERWREGDPDPQARYWERLRLEVAVIGGKERFAWPGSARFEEKDIDEIVPPGAIGTGDFAGFAGAVFRTEDASFEGPREEKLEGRPAYRYDFRVPAERSRYAVRDGRHSAVVGYHGSFWADRETLELLRLDIEADGLPAPPLEVASVKTAIRYQRALIGDSSTLLPRVSELSLSSTAARSSRNRTTFSHCRQYVGESRLRFDEPAPGAEPAARPLERTRLPAGLALELSLETPLDPARAAAGDPLLAVLARDVRREGRLLAPKGARVYGRLRTVRQHLTPRSWGLVALEFDRLEGPSLEAEFRARLELLGSLIPALRRPSDVLVSGSEQESALLFNGPLRSLPRGFRMQWRTY